MAELLYATSHLAGDFTNPDNAVGNTPGTWAGALNENTNRTSRWALGDPVDPLTPAATQTVRVTARKGSNSGTPTVALNLYENGTLVQSILGATNVTSTSGQTLTATFNTSAIADRTAVEVEVVMSAAGGNPSTRNSAQVARIEWEADTSAAGEEASGGSETGATVTAEGAGTPVRSGSGEADNTVTAEGAGSAASSGGAEASVAVTTEGAGTPGAETVEGASESTVTVDPDGSGRKQSSSGAEGSVSVSAEGLGAAHRAGGSDTVGTITTEGAGFQQALLSDLLHSEDFEGVAVSAAVTTSNTTAGTVGAGTGWSDQIGVTPGIHGDRAIRYNSDVVARALWHVTATGILYISAYVRVVALGAGNHTFLWVWDSGGGANDRTAEVRWRSSNADIQIRNGAATAVDTSNFTVSNGDLLRVDWLVNRTGNTQTAHLYRNSNVEGTTPDDTLTGATGTGSGSTFDRVGIGRHLGSAGNTTQADYDSLRIGTTDEVWGPWPAEPPPPATGARFVLSDGETETDVALVHSDGETETPVTPEWVTA